MANERNSRTRSSSSASTSTRAASKRGHGEMELVVTKSPKRTKKSGSKVTGTTSKKKEAKIDAMKPKKPPTAFFYFLEDFRKDYQEQNPKVKSMRDIGKACGEKWKIMTYEEKVQYYDIATEKRADFDKAMADFVKRKESGEFDEFEEDSELD